MAKIDMKAIQELRDRTGLGMMNCKKALEEANGDMQQAVEILRKQGASVAAKRSGRDTGEDKVHAYIHPGARVGVMIEINCETDFVANNENMEQLAKDLCMHIAAMRPLYLTPEDVDSKFLEHGKTIFREQLADSGKPANVLEKIVEGKVNKLFSDICLLKQTYVKNDQLTIEQLLQELIAKTGENIRIKRFARFEVGA